MVQTDVGTIDTNVIQVQDDVERVGEGVRRVEDGVEVIRTDVGLVRTDIAVVQGGIDTVHQRLMADDMGKQKLSVLNSETKLMTGCYKNLERRARNCREWLSAPDPYQNFNTIINGLPDDQPQSWIIDSEPFRKWINGDTASLSLFGLCE